MSDVPGAFKLKKIDKNLSLSNQAQTMSMHLELVSDTVYYCLYIVAGPVELMSHGHYYWLIIDEQDLFVTTLRTRWRKCIIQVKVLYN
jgi:predicted ATP-binding protein involved in virulence